MMRIISGASFPITLINLLRTNNNNYNSFSFDQNSSSNNNCKIIIINNNCKIIINNNNCKIIINNNNCKIIINNNNSINLIKENDILMYVNEMDQIHHNGFFKIVRSSENRLSSIDKEISSFIIYFSCLDNLIINNNNYKITILFNKNPKNNCNTNETQQNDTKNKKKSDYAFNNNSNNKKNNEIIRNKNKTNPIMFYNSLNHNNMKLNVIVSFKSKSGINNKLINTINYDMNTKIIKLSNFENITVIIIIIYQDNNNIINNDVINCQKIYEIKNFNNYYNFDDFNNKIINNNKFIINNDYYNYDDRDLIICDDFLYLTKNNNNNLINNNDDDTLENVINNLNDKIINFMNFTKMPNFIDDYKQIKNNFNENMPTNKFVTDKITTNNLKNYISATKITPANKLSTKFNNNNIPTKYINNKNINISTDVNKINKYNNSNNLNNNSNIINQKDNNLLSYNKPDFKIIENNLKLRNTINNNKNMYKSMNNDGPATNLGWGIRIGSGLKGGGEEKNGNQSNNWNHGQNWPNTNMNAQRNTNAENINQNKQQTNNTNQVGNNTNQSNNPGANNSSVQNANSSSSQNAASNSQNNWNQTSQQQQQLQNVQDPTSIPVNQNITSTVSAANTSGATVPKMDAKLNSLRESLFSVDGWGGNFVNQSTAWDLPKSPQFSKRQNAANNDLDENLALGGDNQMSSNSTKFNSFCWNKINNGTELWEANLRSGGQLGGAIGGATGTTGTTTEKQKKPVPYHPLTNLGGIWGENDFEHDMEMEFNNMDNNQHQNINSMNFNEEDEESIFLRNKKHRTVENFENYDFLVPGGTGTATGGNAGGGGGGGSNGGNGVSGGNSTGGGNAGGSNEVIRGDPRGISGRLNGNPEIWNQNQQNFNQNNNFFNTQNFQNKNQIFQNQQNFMNFTNIDKNQIDFTLTQQSNANFTQNQQKRNAVSSAGAVVGAVGAGGNNTNNTTAASGGGFNNFVDDLGTSIWGNFNQNTQNVSQNPASAINQNFPALRNQNQLNQKRGGGNASNWSDIDKNVGGIVTGISGGGWNKFGSGEKPSSTPWPATPPTPTANQTTAPINPQNPNSIQLSQAQNLINTQKFDGTEMVDWKNNQKNFNINPTQEIFNQNQLAQHPSKSQFQLQFPYPINKNQNQRYNLSTNNELLFPSGGGGNAAQKTKLDDFTASCDFSTSLGDDFLMYNKSQGSNFNQPNSNFNLNYNKNQNLSSLHFSHLNDFGSGGGSGNSGVSNSGSGDNSDRIVRAGNAAAVSGGSGGFHPQSQQNSQMPQSPPIALDNQLNASRILLERGGISGATGMQSVVPPPPPQHSLPLHSQQLNQRGNFVGNFQQTQQNFGQTPIVGNNYSNQPSTSQLRMLVQQITMAVQAGYLNNQILNQPLAPQTLILLNQLLQQIKQLQVTQTNLNRISSGSANSNPNSTIQLSVQANKLKQSITSLQNQIASQQSIYMKQQQSMNDIIGNFNDMNLKENFPSNQSRLNQWKLPSLESSDSINSNMPNSLINLGGDNFSRAPGTISKATTSTTTPNSNIGVGVGGILQPDGTWSNQVRDGGGWPSTESESESNFTDLVPEFEPGKPWKGSQIKTIEEDPSLTPGSVARSPLSICPTSSKETNELFSTNSSKNSPNQEFCLSSNTWSFNPNLSNNPSMTSQKQSSAANELWGSTSVVPSVSSTNDGSKSAPRGPPPGLGKYRNLNNLNFVGIWNSTWLLLKNLTTQIDGSTLRTLCMQHGPLQNFHLYLNHGIALCKYSTREEAQKAQIALNNCVLGNTTICCESPHDSEVSNILQHLGIPPQNLQNSSNNSIGNVTVPMVPVAWRPSSQQVPSSNPTRTNVSDAWGASTVSSASWPTSTTSSASNNSTNIEANENSFLPENLLQSEI